MSAVLEAAARPSRRRKGNSVRTLKRDNERLVTDRITRITRITTDGIATDAGEYRLDVLILAIGFQASS